MIDKPTVGRLPIGEFVLPISLRWPTGLVVTYRVFRYTCTGAHPPPTKVSHSHKPAQGFKRLIAILNWYSFWFNKEKIITAFKIQRPYQHLTCERDLLYMCLLNSWAFAYQYQNVCKEEGFCTAIPECGHLLLLTMSLLCVTNDNLFLTVQATSEINT